MPQILTAVAMLSGSWPAVASHDFREYARGAGGRPQCASYSTAARYSPAASKVGAAWRGRGSPARRRPIPGGACPCRRRPASPRCCAPCDAGTRWRRHRRSRSRRGGRCRGGASVRTGVRAWHSAARNALKSCSPSEEPRRRLHPLHVERHVKPADAAVVRGGTHARGSAARSGSVRRARGVARVEFRAHRARPGHRERRRQQRVRPRAPTRERPLARAVSKCTTCASACTPASVRPAQIVATVSPAISESARSSASCTPQPCGCVCQPQNRLPSYSSPERDSHRAHPARALSKKQKPRQLALPRFDPAPVLRQPRRVQQLLRLRLLLGVAFLDDFLQDVLGAVLVAHLLVRLGEIELGLDVVPMPVLLAAAPWSRAPAACRPDRGRECRA